MRVGIYNIGDNRKYTQRTLYEEPLGGVQTDIILVAEELSKYYDVIVLNPNTVDSHYGNIFYTNYNNIDSYYKDIDAVIVTSSETGIFNSSVKKIGKKIFWKHHQMPHIDIVRMEEMFDILDMCVCISKYNMDEYRKYYESDKYTYIYNPVDLRAADPSKGFTERDNDMIYMSFPNRGLFSFNELLPRINSRLPNVKLYNYGNATIYGWEKSDKEFKEMNRWKSLSSNPNFLQHDSVPYYTLMSIVANTKLFTYPCNFDESFCIAMALAMANGVPCIASSIGSLPSIFPDNDYFVEWPSHGTYDDKYYNTFTYYVEKLYTDVDSWNKASNIATERSKDFDMVKIGMDWKTLLEGL